ncbi:MAG: di-heme oxidoredictase family protein [Acidobacteriota bacterium]
MLGFNRKIIWFLLTMPAAAQLIDISRAPNPAGEGVRKTYLEQIGTGQGDWFTAESSSYIITRDPFRAIRRGRQLFNRKFSRELGLGPIVGDGRGDLGKTLALGAGLSDSCAGCHNQPRGAAGSGGSVVTRPDSRNAPHLFGLGLKEMLADEITAELRARRTEAVALARASGARVVRELTAKGIRYGQIAAYTDGSVDTTGVEGVDADLRVKPFFAEGSTFSIRDFVVIALQNELGLQAVDADLAAAIRGGRVTTQAGMVLDGSTDLLESPLAAAGADPDGDGVSNEVPAAVIDYFEFYLLNYFKPGRNEITEEVTRGRQVFDRIGCVSCHVADLQIDRDRRVADVETHYDPAKGIFNHLFAQATPLFEATNDRPGMPSAKIPAGKPFLVHDIYTDLKRHDLGPDFWERQYDGGMRKYFMTTPLWGAGSTAPYGHDGRSLTLHEVILRHGGEAQTVRDAYAALANAEKRDLRDFIASLILFPPDDTASNLNPGDRSAVDFPQRGHGNIALPVLFNDPKDPE